MRCFFVEAGRRWGVMGGLVRMVDLAPEFSHGGLRRERSAGRHAKVTGCEVAVMFGERGLRCWIWGSYLDDGEHHRLTRELDIIMISQSFNLTPSHQNESTSISRAP